jgi:hypothetical protein
MTKNFYLALDYVIIYLFLFLVAPMQMVLSLLYHYTVEWNYTRTKYSNLK